MEDENFEGKTQEFLTWLSKVGVYVSPKMQLVDLRKEGRGRGAVAVADFEENEIVFRIPRSAVLNIHTTLPLVNNISFQQAISAMPPWLALTTLLIFETLDTDSKWAPYLAVLPRELDSLVFWSESQLAELQASAVVKKIGKAKAEEMFSQHISPLGIPQCDMDMCHRVASIIMAYAFDIPEDKTTEPVEGNTNSEDQEEELVSDDGEDEQTVLSMIPLADMLNADADRNNARLCCDNEELEMRTIKPITKGEEVLNDYGQLPRSDLLRRYGYVTEQYAGYDIAEISTESILAPFRNANALQPSLQSLRLTEKQLQERLELAEREGVYEESYDLAHAGDEGPSIPDELLALVFILLVDEETLASIAHSQSSLPSRPKLATELAGQFLVKALQMRERGYSTPLEDDERMLRAKNLPNRTMMAIEVRLGEKMIIKEAIQEARSFVGSNKHMIGFQNAQTEGLNKKRKAEEAITSRRKKQK